MEVIKTADVPDIVTNMEVLYTLADRIETRKQQQEARLRQQNHAVHTTTLDNKIGVVADINTHRSATTTTSTKIKTHKKLQHRDFIEEKVFQYIQSTLPHITSNSITHVEKRQTFLSQTVPHLVSKLLPRHRDLHKNPNRKVEEEEEEKKDHHPLGSSLGLLTQTEILQILNLMPTERVELHLILENCEQRLDGDQQQRLLESIDTLRH